MSWADFEDWHDTPEEVEAQRRRDDRALACIMAVVFAVICVWFTVIILHSSHAAHAH